MILKSFKLIQNYFIDQVLQDEQRIQQGAKIKGHTETKSVSGSRSPFSDTF